MGAGDVIVGVALCFRFEVGGGDSAGDIEIRMWLHGFSSECA